MQSKQEQELNVNTLEPSKTMQGYTHIGIMMDSDTAGEYMGNMRGIGENICHDVTFRTW